MSYARRTDGNHADIVEALRRVGCRVLDLSRVGGGCPDLLVDCHGELVLMEVKTPGGRMRAQQRLFANDWPVSVVRSVDEALRIVGAR